MKETRNSSKKIYQEEHKKRGLCYYCCEPALSHRKYPILTNRCAYHTLMNQKYNRKYYIKRKEEIIRRVKERIQKNIELGLCRCGNEKDEDMDKGQKVCYICRMRCKERS